MADDLGGDSATNGRIEPKDYVFVQRFDPLDEDNRFIGRLTLGILLARCFVEPQVLMVQHPVGLDIVGRLVSGNGALKDPMAGQTIEQGILKCRLLR